MTSVLPGFLVTLALIVAIGAQNAFVLRQGVVRQHVGVVVVLCAASDAVLITVGVGGLGRLLEVAPWFVDAARWGGAAFLLAYAALAARRALRPAATGLDPASAGRLDEPDEPGEVDAVERRGGATTVAQQHRSTLLPVVATTLALTWLNPHVYLDTVVLLGSVAATHGDDRWWFAAGAVAASATWFSALGLGARHLGRWLRTPRAWQVLDGLVAATMVVLAVAMLAG